MCRFSIIFIQNLKQRLDKKSIKLTVKISKWLKQKSPASIISTREINRIRYLAPIATTRTIIHLSSTITICAGLSRCEILLISRAMVCV